MSKSKPKKYHDIVLAEGLNKDYILQREIMDQIMVSSAPISILSEFQKSHNFKKSNYYPTNLNSILGKGYYFEDSDGVVFRSTDLFYKRDNVGYGVGIDFGVFSLERKKRRKREGLSYGATLFYENFSFRLGLNKYDDFSEIIPTVKYANTYKKHSYELEYTRKNSLFYTYSLASYRKRIIANHFSVSDFTTFSNSMELWANASVNAFSNEDIGTTLQFDLVAYKNRLFTNKFTYALAIDGWYTSHTRENRDFYSPRFTDATIFRIDPKYLFSKWFGIQAKVGAGYSVRDETKLYKYGLWAYGKPLNNFTYSIGCLKSNSAKHYNGTDYYYSECEAELGYSW